MLLKLRNLFLCALLFAGMMEVIAGYSEYVKAAAVPWWKDVVIYQVYPRSLYDGNPDGTGDLRGIISKASYLQSLGVGAVWLSPVYASPMADFGYDISNFTDIDPIFGSMEEFEELLNTLHQLGLKIIMDIVPNHSSDEHEWFIKSVQMEEPYTDYYVWSDPIGFNETGDPIPPNNWLSAFRGPAWKWVDQRQQFYLHQFLVKQPDLNYRNSAVREEMKGILRFWLDKGVDGIRVDAFDKLIEVEDIYQDEPIAIGGSNDPWDYNSLNHTLTLNQPETYAYLAEMREVLDGYTDRFMVVEVGGTMEQLMAYYGNETFILADFPFNFKMIELLHNRTDVTGISLKSIIDLWLDNMPEGRWPNWVLGNHDRGRVATRLGKDLVDALNMMSLLLPGTACTYYGEEIGMENTWISWEDTQDPEGCNWGPDKYEEHSRDPERTPMQWDDSAFAGFTMHNDTWLPVNKNYRTLNVKAQTEAEMSHLKVYQNITQLRKEDVFRLGDIAYPVITEDIFSFIRYLQDSETYLLVINTSEVDMVVNLHHSASFQLPDTGTVVMRSITDTSVENAPGSVVSLENLTMKGGEGMIISLGILL